MALGSLLAGGAPVGWGIAYGLILLAKFFAARWALRSLLAPNQVAILSILAVVMIPWEGQWREHNVPMQSATLFMILAVGSILRCRDELRWLPSILTVIFVAMSIASYEALLIVCLALPVMTALSPGHSTWQSAMLRTAPLVVVPMLVFAATLAAMILRSGSRWTGLLSFPTKPSDNILDAITLLYSTAYLKSAMTLLALPLYIFLLSGSPDRSQRTKLLVLATSLLVLLPWASVPFMSSYSYLKDAERVGLPVGFGFFMLCTVVALVSRSEPKRSVTNIVIASMTLTAAATAYSSWKPYGEMQRPVLKQVRQLLMSEPGKRVLVRDMTNRLGDVYTFQNPNVFRDALQVLGVNAEHVDLCLIETPANRFHPDFVNLEFPVSPVPVCQPTAPGSVVLDVLWTDREPLVVRAQ